MTSLLDPALLDQAIGAFVTLFVVIDPIGLAPIFVAVTAGAAPAERRRIAVAALAIGAFVLTGFGLGGRALLDTIGIGLPAFRISGGIMLFIIALEMLFEKRTERRSKTADESDAVTLQTDPTVFPLATPLIAGPGAMAAMILLTSEATTPSEHLVVYGCMALVLLICVPLFLASSLIERVLGQSGVKLVTRLLGVLLGALAVQFVLDGLAAYGMTLSAA